MPKLLYSQSTQQIHGYPRSDDKPIVGLDPDFLVLERTEGTIPAYDPETELISPNWVVDLDNLEYRQEWVVNPIALQPNWDGFNAAILANVEFNQATGAVLQSAPSLALALPAALAQVSSNGVSAFGLVFNSFCAVGQVSSEQRGEWADMAESFNLPGDFVEVVRG